MLGSAAVETAGPAAASALTHQAHEQQRHGASLQHEVQEQSASVRPAAGDAGCSPHPTP